MRSHYYLFCVALLAGSTPVVVRAQDRMLVVQVTDTRERPVAGVVLSTKGEGAVGPPTDISGKTRIRLAQQTRADSLVSLIVVKVLDGQDLAFMSPWNGQVRVPPFENESENFVPVVLVSRTVREQLQSGKALTDSLMKSLAGSRPTKRPSKKG